MSILSDLTLEEAVNNIKQHVAAMAPASAFSARHASERAGLRPRQGKPTLTVRFMGDQDDGNGLQTMKLPRGIILHIRIYYPIVSAQGKNSLEEAQAQTLRGDSAWRAVFYEDRTLGNRFPLGSIIDNVEAGEMLDPEGNSYYGHELTLYGLIH